MNSNVKSDSDLIATNRSVAKAVLAIHVIIAELANKKLRPTKGILSKYCHSEMRLRWEIQEISEPEAASSRWLPLSDGK